MILKVAKREYLETVKTKTFILSILLTPVMIVGIIYLSHKMSTSASSAKQPALKVVINDLSGWMNDEIETSFNNHNNSPTARKINLEQTLNGNGTNNVTDKQKQSLRDGIINAYVVIDKNVADGDGKFHLYTNKIKPSDADILGTVENILNRSVVSYRCKIQNLSPQILSQIQRYIPTERVELGAVEDQDRVAKKQDKIIKMMVPFFFMYLMFMGLFGVGQQMLTSVIEEKSSRVIEVLLSALTPMQLMAGKILGLAAIGLTVIGIWGFSAYGAAAWAGLHIEISVRLLIFFIIFFVLGFTQICAILAGIGSICNTVKESQSLMTPITLMCIVPMLAWMNITQNPDGALARILSFIPPMTPMVMILRISANPELALIEIFAAVGVLLIATPATIWIAARIFRTGVLMYGKRPGLREIIRSFSQAGN